MIRLPRWVLVVLLLISILFTIAGIGMIATGAEGGWVGFLFFGLASINASIVGKNSALPDTYGMPAEELKTLMNGWRERALRAG